MPDFAPELIRIFPAWIGSFGINTSGFGLDSRNVDESSAGIPTDLCNPGNADPSGWVVDPSGLYPDVTQIGGSSAGGLFVNFNGSSVQLQ